MSRKKRPWYKPRKSRASQRWALGIVVLCLGLAAWYAQRAYREVVDYPERGGAGSAELHTFEVPRGSSLPSIIDLLVEEEVLAEEDARYFKLYVLHKGAAAKITAGEHSLSGDMSASEILAELMRAQPSPEVRVTVPEGKQILEVSAILAKAGLGSEEEFVALVRDPAFAKELGIPGPTLEGYLFPDTYKFSKKSSPKAILKRMVDRHQTVYDELARRFRQEGTELEKQFGWKQYEIVTLASIIEKETAQVTERPLISSVFQNRLRFSSFKPKLLQTDPTIVYGCVVPLKKSAACEKFEGRIRTIQLRDKDNPYSTYAHEGLPPGPISNPGEAAIQAVFRPTKSRYLYFVSKNDGTHVFSKTVAEHERAVDKYQRGNG